jgi:hypothetical protein
VQSIFTYHLIQSHKIKKIDFEQKKIFFVHAHNSQLIQRTHLRNSHQKKIIRF